MKKIILLFAVLLAACSAGTPFELDKAAMVKPGMTEQEVISIIGSDPLYVGMTPQGKSLIWSYGTAFSGGKAFSVMLDKDSRVIEMPSTAIVNK